MPVLSFVARNGGYFLAAPFVLVFFAAGFFIAGSKFGKVIGATLLAGGALSLVLFIAATPYL